MVRDDYDTTGKPSIDWDDEDARGNRTTRRRLSAVTNERGITPAELWSTFINVEALSGIDVSKASVSERPSGCALPD